MSAEVQFPAEAVRQHAGAVNEAAERMAVARSAVHEVSMDSQAYGEICRFLPGLLSPLFGAAVEILNGAVDALSETALKLRTTVETLRVTDLDSARRLNEASQPPGPPV